MIEQGTDEWFLERMGRATASQFHHILAKGAGKGRKDYMRRLITERLTNTPMEGFDNADTRRGVEQEPHAKMHYTARTGRIIEDVGFIKHPEIMAGCSPDGLVGDDGIIEIKSVKETVQLETMSSKMPKSHYPQINGCLWITGRKWCDFVSYSPNLPDNLSLYVERIRRSDADILYIDRDVRLFLKELEEELEYFRTYEGSK